MMKKQSRRYIQSLVIAIISVISPAWGIVYQNGNVSFLGAAVKQGCTAEIRHQNQVNPGYTIELDECPWQEADAFSIITSTAPNVGRIPAKPGNTVIYSGNNTLGRYLLFLPGQVFDLKEASVITVYYP